MSSSMVRVICGLIAFLMISIPTVTAIIIARDAKARGMNGVGWGIGVFMVLIVFLPLYLVVRKPLTLPMISSATRALLCATCGKYSTSGGRFCQFCGQELAR